MLSSLNSTSVTCTNAQGPRQRRAVALSLLALSALSLAAGCAFPSTEGKSVSGLDELIQAKSTRSVPAHAQPGWQAHPSTQAPVVRQTASHCELPGLEPDTVDVDLWSRLKLDYEQHCYSYKRGAMLVRRQLRGLVDAMIGGDRMGDKVEGAKAAVSNAVAPTDIDIVVPDTVAAPTVVGPTSTGTVSASSPPKDAKFYRESAIAAYGNGDLPLALVYFDRAIRLDPSFEDAYIDRSIVLYRLGALDFAFDDVARARGIENSHRILMPPLPKTSPLPKDN
jgi:tetratricopeptide (TPR) repeat protein